MIEAEHRPADFERRIMERHTAVLRPSDALIVLGDNALGKTGEEMLGEFVRGLADSGSYLFSVRGNHDQESMGRRLFEGWGFVGDSLTLKMFGKRILFTHEPVQDLFGADLNIHGHLHSIDGHRGKLINDGSHALYSSELCDYRPVPLEFMASGATPKWENGRMVRAL